MYVQLYSMSDVKMDGPDVKPHQSKRSSQAFEGTVCPGRSTAPEHNWNDLENWEKENDLEWDLDEIEF